MIEFITLLSSNWDTIGHIMTGIVTTASAVAAITPTPADGIGRAVYGVIDMLALNVGKAKDKVINDFLITERTTPGTPNRKYSRARTGKPQRMRRTNPGYFSPLAELPDTGRGLGKGPGN